MPTATGVASLWREPAEITRALEGNGNVNGGEKGRYGWAAVWNTQLVYQLLNRLPSNKQIVTRLPAKQVLSTVGEDTVNLLVEHRSHGEHARDDRPAADPRRLGQPDHLRRLRRAGGGDVEARERAATPERDASPAPDVFDYSGDRLRHHQPPADRRPFFASAGPDGDFKLGDDNMYSFEQ